MGLNSLSRDHQQLAIERDAGPERVESVLTQLAHNATTGEPDA